MIAATDTKVVPALKEKETTETAVMKRKAWAFWILRIDNTSRLEDSILLSKNTKTEAGSDTYSDDAAAALEPYKSMAVQTTMILIHNAKPPTQRDAKADSSVILAAAAVVTLQQTSKAADLPKWSTMKSYWHHAKEKVTQFLLLLPLLL